MPAAPVNTAHVSGRRRVRLRSIDDLDQAADDVAAAVAAGAMRPLGNWSPGQVLWHIAKLIELSFDGFPFRYKRGPVWLTRLLGFVSWRGLIWIAFWPGFRNPPYAAVLEPDPALTLDEAVAYLRQQIGRIRNGERMTQASGVEGPYRHDQWVYVHLRHAELHLSFLAIADR
jgi:hypothetical protein